MFVESKSVKIESEASVVFNMLNNCSNIGTYLPSSQNFVATAKQCSFTIEGVGNLEMQIVEEIEFSKIVYLLTSAYVSGDVKMTFDISTADDGVYLKALVDVEVPFFMAQMIKSPIQKFVDVLTEKVKLFVENKN